MSGSEKAHFGLTRRGFLKATGAAVSLAALGSLVGCVSQQADDKLAVTGSDDQIFRGVCRPNCFGFCHLNVHVRDGLVVKTSRAPYANEEYNRICHRGLSHVQRIYDPERIKYPLKRSENAERGSGNWERISWDEAIELAATWINESRESYGNKAFAFMNVSGNQSIGWANMYTRLVNLLNGTSIGTCVDMASYYGLIRVTGLGTLPWEANERMDIPNARNVVAWGANITSSQPQDWHFINEAHQNGASLIVIDPTFTPLAAKADKWIPIRPATDTALYLGIINQVIARGDEDKEFLLQHTCAPFLVDPDTKMFLRSDVTAQGEENDHTGVEGEYVVIENGTLTPLNLAQTPDMDAEIVSEGKRYRTAFSLLKEAVADYTPEYVAEITEVCEDDLSMLVDICLDGPVTHYVGFGSQAYSNGAHTTHAGITMCAVTGNLGKPGASYGSLAPIYLSLNPAFSAPNGPNETPAVAMMALPEVMQTGMFMGEEHPIKTLLVAGANPLCCACDTNLLLESVWSNLDHVIVADSAMTDTARYADLVLPIAQFFEVTDVTNAGSIPVLSYNEKAIDPPHEAKSDFEIVRLLAEKLGLKEYFAMSDEDVFQELLDTPTSKDLGITLERLKEEKEVRYTSDCPHVAFRDGQFTTSSGRLEFYLEAPFAIQATDREITPDLIDRERLPKFFPPNEAWYKNDRFKEYPIICMSERPRYRVHSQWFSTPLLRELDPEPIVKINPVDSESREIRDGDYVECFNDRGHVVAKAVLTEGVKPGTIVYPKGWQMEQFKAGSWSELLSADYDPFAVNSNFMDCLCEMRVWREGDSDE